MTGRSTKLLEALGRAIVRRPKRFVAGALIGCALLAGAALFVPKDLSFRGILDDSDPRVQQYFALSDELNVAGQALILLEGADDARLLEAARIVERELEALAGVADVVVESPQAWLAERAPWFVDDETFDAWIGLADGPLEAGDPAEVQALLDRAGHDLPAVAVPGARLLSVQLADDPFEIKVGIPSFLAVHARSNELAEELGVELGWTGIAAISAQDQLEVLSGIVVLVPMALIVVLLLLRFVEPRWLHLAAVALPMVLAAAATLGVVGLLLGKITFAEGHFGILLFGLGVDIALHLVVRNREERAGGRSLEEALPRVLAGAGPAVVVGAVTTAGAFGVAAFAPEPMAAHIGAASGVGLALCLVLMLTLLPATWVLLERRSSSAPARPMSLPLLRPLASHAARHPLLHLGIALVVVAVALAGAPRLRWETDLAKVFSRDMPALETGRRVQELFGTNGSAWIVPTQGLDEARRVTRALQDDPTFSRVEGIGRLFTADLDERARRLAEAAPLLAERTDGQDGLDPGEAAGTRALLDALGAAHAAGQPGPETLPVELRSRLVAPSGRYLVFAWAGAPHLDGRRAGEERRRVQAIHPDAAGFGSLLEVLMATERPWMGRVLAAIGAFVLLLLFVDLRDPRWVIAALAPVAVGTAVTFGALCWLDVGFNAVTAVAVPLLLGLGVDDGIHVVHRLREQPPLEIADGVVRVGRAIVMTTVTTCASVAMLLFTGHAGLESIALVLLVGLPVCLVASITLVPALAVVLRAPRGQAATARPGSPRRRRRRP